jgi:hypothetical protein
MLPKRSRTQFEILLTVNFVGIECQEECGLSYMSRQTVKPSMQYLARYLIMEHMQCYSRMIAVDMHHCGGYSSFSLFFYALLVMPERATQKSGDSDAVVRYEDVETIHTLFRTFEKRAQVPEY